MKYTKACDVFSAGVVLFILLTGYPPFDQSNKNDKWYRPLYKENTELFWKQHKGCGVPDACRSLIEGMLAYDPKKRFTMEAVVGHEWCKGETWTKEELKKELKALHKIARTKRKGDKKKMADMACSVKRRDIPAHDFKELANAWGTVPKSDTCFINSFIMPKGEKTEDTFQRFLALRQVLQNRIDENLLWNGVANLSKLNPELPYYMELSTDVLPSGSGDDEEKSSVKSESYSISFSVVENEDGEAVFNMGRLSGSNPLRWNKLFGDVEDVLLASDVFNEQETE